MNLVLRYKNILMIIIVLLLFTSIGLSYLENKCLYDNKIIDKKVQEIKKIPNYVKIENIDEKYLNSVIDIEDHRFYEHGAIDFISILRSIIHNIIAGKVIEGGSTITQQLAKNMCLSNERNLSRKIKELLLSIQLERKYTKSEILELYVNIICFGDGYFGISNASKGYFKKTPWELNFNEATILAGIPQAHSIYALSKNNGLAKKRQKQVIRALIKYGNTYKNNKCKYNDDNLLHNIKFNFHKLAEFVWNFE